LPVILQAVIPHGAAEPLAEELSVSSSFVKVTSFTKKEVSLGGIAPLWFTLASSDNQPQHVIFQVRLPAASVTYREAAVFPPLDDESPAPQLLEYEDKGMVVLVWPDVALAPGQSRVFNVDVKIEAISEQAPVLLEALVTVGHDVQSSVLLDTLPVTLTKRPKVTKALLREKAVEKLRANPPRDYANEYETFAKCKPLREGPAAVEDCLAACHHEQAQGCMACGYDPQGGCLCKGKGGEGEGQEDRYLDGVPILYDQETEEEGKEEEGGGQAAAQPLRPRFLDRRGEILVFPGLFSEEQCVEMEGYLAELVAEYKAQRLILPGVKDGPLHALVREVLPVPGATFEEFVTFSEEDVEVEPHYDEVKNGETHKLLLFLDTVAGTRFWETKEEYQKKHCPLLVGPARGMVVIFPMSLYHDSARYEPQYSIKRTLGLRMSLPPFDPLAGERAIGLVQAEKGVGLGAAAAAAVAVEAR
jgi:hypothetical protein